MVTELHIQGEMARAFAATEGLAFVASQIFGGSKKKGEKIETMDAALDFARFINGG